MMTVDQVIEFMDKIPGSFTRTNAIAYYMAAIRACLDARNGATLVEIGVDQGRSASVLLHAATEAAIKPIIVLVDSWPSVLIDNKYRVKKLVTGFPARGGTLIMHGLSVDVAATIHSPIDMILIDANHTEGNPQADCKAWLPKLRPGGVVCFHDYGEPCFPDVVKAVEEYTSEWDNLGLYEGLLIKRKPVL